MSASIITLDELRSLTERDFYPDQPIERTGYAALDRAAAALDSDPWRFQGLLVTLKMLHKDRIAITEENVDRIARANDAAKLLRQAQAIINDLGSPHVAGIIEDVIRAAPMTARARVFMDPLPPPSVEAHKTRMRPLWEQTGGTRSWLLHGIKAHGKALCNSEAATRGAVVRTVAAHIPAEHPERYAIIAGLCGLVGYKTSGPDVRKILLGYQRPDEHKSEPVDALAIIQRAKASS